MALSNLLPSCTSAQSVLFDTFTFSFGYVFVVYTATNTPGTYPDAYIDSAITTDQRNHLSSGKLKITN